MHACMCWASKFVGALRRTNTRQVTCCRGRWPLAVPYVQAQGVTGFWGADQDGGDC